MPKKCECPRCEKFRDKNPPTLDYASAAALEKANQPSPNSRRAKIKAGLGKNGKRESDGS